MPREPHFTHRDIATRCEELLRLSSGQEPNLREIARCTSEIPSLAQRVLQRANSARLGLRHRISDVDHAVVFLGADRVGGLVRQLLVDTANLHEVARSVNPETAMPSGPEESQTSSSGTY